MRVNLRYLQNTLEQLIVFAVGLLTLAAYMKDGGEMRAVLATTIVWVLARFAFWIGYHRSAALRGLGAPGMMAGMLMLLYGVWRIGRDVGGTAAAVALIAAFLANSRACCSQARVRGAFSAWPPLRAGGLRAPCPCVRQARPFPARFPGR